jgi:hypothetical protein
MRVAIASIVVLLGSGVWCGAASTAAAQNQPTTGQPVAGQGGAKYAHTLGASRFAVGDGSHRETEGPFERVIGDKGVFFVDTVTGATLAVPNGAAVPKPPADAPASANSPEALNYPQPMTTNPNEHSAAVAAYLVAAGVPAAEVSGMHVTTTMAGGGPVRDGVQPAQSKLLWYTTHLERSLGGVPVESSYAFAALDNAGRVITEGVYWPAIPAGVVSNARGFAAKLAAPRERAAFMAKVGKAAPGAGNTPGSVRIVHTSGAYHGPFQAAAVYSTVVPSRRGGKAQILRFDENGARVRLNEEASTETDSPKQQ